MNAKALNTALQAKLSMLLFYLGVPAAFILPIIALNNNSHLKYAVPVYLKTFLPFFFGYTLILAIISFTVSYRLLAKTEI